MNVVTRSTAWETPMDDKHVKSAQEPFRLSAHYNRLIDITPFVYVALKTLLNCHDLDIPKIRV